MVKKRQTIELAGPTLSSQQASPLLQKQIEEGQQLLKTESAKKSTNRFSQSEFDDNNYRRWHQTCFALLEQAFGQRSDNRIAFYQARSNSTAHIGWDANEKFDYKCDTLKAKITSLESCLEQVNMGLGSPIVTSSSINISELSIIDSILIDKDMLKIIKRDRLELQGAMLHGHYKSVLLLAGSILEGILIDILDRRRDKAQTHMKNHKIFPRDAALSKLLDIAGNHTLLTQASLTLSGTIIDHRDLIHPYSEKQNNIIVDESTSEAIVCLLKNVIRDLIEADKNGLINNYVNV